MSDKTLNYQLNMFANLTDLSATPQNTVELMNLFSEFGFLPNTIQEINNLSPAPVLRPRFVSPDGEWAVSILSQQIVIDRNYNGSEKTMEDFIKEASKILEIFIKKYDRKGKRISLVSKTILSEMPSEQLNRVYNEISKPIPFYSEVAPFEWNLRSVANLNYPVAGEEEKVNVITTISRVQGQANENGSISNFDRISLDFDINTVLESDQARLSYAAISDFLQEAIRTRIKLFSEFKVVIYDKNI